jgi:hypothetical protein
MPYKADDASPSARIDAPWLSGTVMPASFAAAEVIPERPVRRFDANDTGKRESRSNQVGLGGTEPGEAR